jgi:hypothetical protein
MPARFLRTGGPHGRALAGVLNRRIIHRAARTPSSESGVVNRFGLGPVPDVAVIGGTGARFDG